jgi:hypothetical protein
MTGGTKRQKDMRKALRALLPRVPMADAEAILEGALAGHLKHLPPSIALWQAVTSHVRHALTDYDALLADGYDRDAARFFRHRRHEPRAGRLGLCPADRRG